MQSQDIEKLPLWNHFTQRAPADLVSNVQRLVNDAAALLDRIIETFPTYTLHDSRHAFNVARLMGILVGEHALEQVRQLVPLGNGVGPS